MIDWFGMIMSVTTLIAGGGWFVCYREYRRKKKGEAAQAEADGWKAQQDVYQQTIKDLQESCKFIREERDGMREENRRLKEENIALREKYHTLEELIIKSRKEHEQQIIDLRKDIARQGRKLESILPFACGVAGCQKRTRVELQQSDNSADEQDLSETDYAND